MMIELTETKTKTKQLRWNAIFLQEILLLTSMKSSPHINCTIYKQMPLKSWYNQSQSCYPT